MKIDKIKEALYQGKTICWSREGNKVTQGISDTGEDNLIVVFSSGLVKTVEYLLNEDNGSHFFILNEQGQALSLHDKTEAV